MNECLDTDTLLSIGDALDWDVAEGLRHLETCDGCRATLEGMRLARTAFLESEAVDAAVVLRISTAVGALAQRERSEARRPHRWIAAIEPVAAGVAALVVVASSGIGITSITAVLAFVLGAGLMVGGQALVRTLPTLSIGG